VLDVYDDGFGSDGKGGQKMRQRLGGRVGFLSGFLERIQYAYLRTE